MTKKRILLIEICNFDDYPIGGYLSFAKQMLTAFGNNIALVGLTTDDTPIGVWTKKDINGVTFDYFSVAKVKKNSKKTFIPIRLKSYISVLKYRQKILSIGIRNAFIQTPEVLFAINNRVENICVRIPGVENSLSISRYWYGKYFAKIFDYFYFRKINQTKIILASADSIAIKNFIKRSKGILSASRVIQFPTRVDTTIFKKIDKEFAQTKLGLPNSHIVVMTSGRLSELKGWKFMLECFIKFKTIYPDSIFVFVGDGEDRLKIEDFIEKKGIHQNVYLAGRQPHEILSMYLNASDLYIMGSFVEGWATSLVEAIACEKPVVCTNFSSARELIHDTHNGFVIENRNQDEFVTAMINSLNISTEKLTEKSLEIQRFSVYNLKNEILNYWKLF